MMQSCELPHLDKFAPHFVIPRIVDNHLDFGDRRHNLETIPRLVGTDLVEFRGYGACPRNPIEAGMMVFMSKI